MKSRKLKAVLAAVSALAVLATAMTGFAATVTTTTKYATSETTGKVEVTAVVAGANGSEITYLVKTNGTGVADGIVYIDQQTTDGGAATFTYKVDKAKIGNYEMNVTMGSNDEDTFEGEEITLTGENTVTGDGYTIAYPAYAAGDATITVAITPAEGYQIDSVTIDGKNEEIQATYDVAPTATIAVVASKTVVAPGFTAAEKVVVEDFAGFAGFGDDFATKHEGKKINATIMSVKGTPYQVGVEYNGELYPAMSNTGNVAVILLSDGEEVATTPYYIAEEGGDAVYESAN